MTVAVSDLHRNAWRLSPAAMAEKLSDGQWRSARHLQLLNRVIVRAVARGNGRILITMPPGHGKSEFLSHWTPTWAFHLDPSTRVILASYEASLAQEWGRAVRNTIVECPELEVPLAPDAQAASRWRTQAKPGGMWTAGAGGTITGRRGNIIIIDDPHKNFAEANSATERENVWNWYTSTVRSRIVPANVALGERRTTIIVIQTRWHEDDLAGRLIEGSNSGNGETWFEVRLPALAEEDEPAWPDGLGRLEGEPLWPEAFDLESLLDTRKAVGLYVWNGLYQQRPSALEGDIFDTAKWEWADAVPSGCRWMRRWDLSGTTEGDWTVGALVAFHQGRGQTFVVDVVRERPGADVENLVRSTAELDLARPYGRRIKQRIEQEGGSSGRLLMEHYARDLMQGIDFDYKPTTGDKALLAMPFAAQQQAGNVYLVRVPDDDHPGGFVAPRWVPDFVEEHRQFPNSKYDDQVDATSKCYLDLVATPRKRRARASSAADRHIYDGR